MPLTPEEQADIEARFEALEEQIRRLKRKSNVDPRIPLLATGFDVEDALFSPAVRVNKAGAQTTTNNALFTLLFDTEGFDTDNMHDLVSNTSRLTATTAGIYYIEGQVQFAAHATGDRFLRMFLNGTTTISETRLRAAAGAHRQQCGMLFALSAGDYVELLTFQNSGGDLGVAPVRFYMFWVAPAP
ncbi:hypothetical protein LCGC14_2822820 [marine sediment metagenome]|uniref:C1q domain-containing protein n=1 Tax=marine sediment metagenome TaxID=412755 RepID=A0A0F8Z379_9ZZZZ